MVEKIDMEHIYDKTLYKCTNCGEQRGYLKSMTHCCKCRTPLTECEKIES